MFKDNKALKYALIYGAIIIVLVFSFNVVRKNMVYEKIDYSTFKSMLEKNEISSVVISYDEIQITPKEGTDKAGKILHTPNLASSGIQDPDLTEQLTKAGVKYDGKPMESYPIIDLILCWVLPFLLLAVLGRFIFSKMDKKMGGGVMSFGKNNAKLYAEDQTGKTFDDVAGQEEAKESLQEIVDFLHNTQKYTEIGAKLPKGALLVGPPGTGKTLLAKAVAGEAKVPFFSLSGSDFVEMFVGMGAARVRDLFRQAEEKAPCIVFIDEIDAIGKSRDGAIQGNDEREQTLNQLLTEMDGFDSSKGVVILAATNRPEVLDKALLRPGRFDRRVIVDSPDLIGREAILKVHVKDVKLGDDVSLEAIAKSTPGAVGADLANIVNEAALSAVKHGRKYVIQEDLEEAVEVIIAGKEKKDRIMSPHEKKIVAYHEVGHALVAALLNNTDPVHKITIIPRTMGALGYTMQLPEEEKYLVSKDEMIEQISVMFGGRAAEEVEFNSITTGASNDIERATQTARNMVTVYGMTNEFDMMALESPGARYLDGRNVRNCSEETSTKVDQAILKIIKTAHEKAVNILKENKDLLDEISDVLLDKETIMGEEFMEIVYSKYPKRREVYEKIKKEKELLKEQVMEKRKEKEEAIKQAKEEMLRLEKEQMSIESEGIEDLVSELEHASKNAENNEEVSLKKDNKETSSEEENKDK
ncbi:ATP-dependent zinc metalloprotease FtsH [Clostridium tarantellae]|uniref:ATP-dependent zinc metalloprotease FtsH n=1 Tax=Clostridium tarantellae TaxID=39493 RepID=A0A6I1MNX1_9CLOT|nr:ATP-dependent zinc metalloprotease FtsH [Clostridium tarantellae]MPQ42601.1 ATP-dependent zinc metalloprotease FtsH [Clostridium tarantellae]